MKPKILFINRVYPPHRSPTERLMRDVAMALAAQGWDVHVLTTGVQKSINNDNGITVHRTKGPDKPRGFLGYFWLWMKMLFISSRLGSHDVVVTLTDPPMSVVIGRFLSILQSAKHIHWCHDLYPDLLPVVGARVPEFLMSFLHNRSRGAMRASEKVVVPGFCMAKHLTYDEIEPSKITVIPNWVEPEIARQSGKKKFNKSSSDPVTHHKNAMKHGSKPYEYLLRDGLKFRVLHAGNIGKAHQMAPFFEVLQEFNSEHPEIEFIFVGDGPEFEKISDLRSTQALDNIRMIPYQPAESMRDVIEASDVHFVSMKNEAGGLLIPCKFYTAISARRPCIFAGPPHSEPAKVIQDFECGVIIDPDQKNQIRDAILHYRFHSNEWYKAYNGMVAASKVFVPQESIDAWVRRAEQILTQGQTKALKEERTVNE